MAEMIQTQWTASGATLYALVRNSDGEVWDTVLGGWVPYATVDLANYVIPLVEQGTASQFYTADSLGPFGVMVARAAVYEQLGGSPAEGDTPLVVVDLSLTAFQALESVVGALSGNLFSVVDNLRDSLQKWLRVLFRSDAAIAIDGADDVDDINADQGSGPGSYDNTTDSVQAIRDTADNAVQGTLEAFQATELVQQMLMLLSRSDPEATNDFATAMNKINEDGGSGPGSYDNIIDSLQAVAAGGGGLDAAGVRAAVGLASANLDTQLDALPTNAELATALAAADDAVLAAVATRSSQTSVDDLPTNAELATSQAAADDATLAAIAGLNNLSSAQAQTAAAAALTAYDPPTEAEMNARTLAAAAITKLTAHTAAVTMVVIGTGSTTTSIVLDPATGVDGGAPPSGADVFNRRVLVFTSGALNRQALTISDYDGSTGTLTMAAPGFTGSAAAGVIGVVV